MADDRKPHYEDEDENERDVLIHVHAFLTMADASHHHQHMLLGTTGPAIARRDSHVHRIVLRTSSDPQNGDTHWHEVRTTTGPALETPNGEHTHYYRGETSFDLDHCHNFASVTDTAPNLPEEEECEDEEPVHHHHPKR